MPRSIQLSRAERIDLLANTPYETLREQAAFIHGHFKNLILEDYFHQMYLTSDPKTGDVLLRHHWSPWTVAVTPPE